jgi:hypothetical protein
MSPPVSSSLSTPVVDAFYAEDIGVGHALLLAKLQPDQQQSALSACFREDWQSGSGKQKRILLPIRNLQFWIDNNILLILKDAPFDKKDRQRGLLVMVHTKSRHEHDVLQLDDLRRCDNRGKQFRSLRFKRGAINTNACMASKAGTIVDRSA